MSVPGNTRECTYKRRYVESSPLHFFYECNKIIGTRQTGYELKLVSSANGHHLETDLAKGIAVKDHAPIKHERGFLHRVVHGAPVNVPELLPLGRDDDRFAVLGS
jgi:hypothetical protein